MIKRIITALLNLISFAAIAAAATALLCVVLTPVGDVPSLMGYTLLRVMTGSMEPAVPTNSLIVVRQVDASEVRAGDVITFYSSDPEISGSPNTHRVVSVHADQSFTTKGDANSLADNYPVQPENLIGKVVLVAPLLGRVVTLVVNPLVFLLVIILPLVCMLIHSLYKVLSTAKMILQKEEQAAVAQALQDLAAQKKAIRAAGASENRKETDEAKDK